MNPDQSHTARISAALQSIPVDELPATYGMAKQSGLSLAEYHDLMRSLLIEQAETGGDYAPLGSGGDLQTTPTMGYRDGPIARHQRYTR